MTITTVIFDLNGTLLDDYDFNIKAFQIIFNRLGLHVPANQIDRLMGTPTSHVIEHILNAYNVTADFKALAEEKVENYIRLTNKKNIFFPETVETILALKKRYRLSLFTGVTRMQVNRLGDFLDHFEFVVAGEEAIKPKPAPDTLLHMLKKMGCQPAACAYVGDMPLDMLLANNAGVKAIGRENKLFSRKDLIDSGAERVIENLTELLSDKIL